MKDENKWYIVRMFALLLVLLAVGCMFIASLQSCRSVYINPKLPEYNIEKFERPAITDQSGDTIKLMRYAMKLEEQISAFEQFYTELKSKY